MSQSRSMRGVLLVLTLVVLVSATIGVVARRENQIAIEETRVGSVGSIDTSSALLALESTLSTHPTLSGDYADRLVGTSSALLAPESTLSTHPTLSGDYADRLVDTDSDGQLDALEIDAGVNVTVPFTYSLMVTLANLSGEKIATHVNQVELQSGFVTMTVRFAGMNLLASGEDGPYVVKYAELWKGTDHVDFEVEPYTTSTFQLSALQPRTVRLLDSYTDTAVDHNGDGRFDVLRISAAVDVPDAGVYDVSASLVDNEWNLIFSREITVTLSASDEWVDIEIPAAAIRAAHVDGPYQLVSLSVGSDYRPLRNGSDVVHATSPYDYTMFGQSGAPSVTIEGEELIDIEGSNVDPLDVAYEYLRVKLAIDGLSGVSDERVNVDVTLVGEGGVAVARVERSYRIDNLSQTANGVLVDVDIPGGEIYNAGIDGPYKVGVVLWSETRDEILDEQNATYGTSAYSAANFALPLIEIDGPTDIVAVDDNQNGKFERLEFRIPVIAGQRGEITAQGKVVAASGQEVAKVELGFDQLAIQAASAPGEVVTLVLVVPGSVIAASGLNGPYSLRNLFMYHKNDARQYILLEEAGTSSSYVASQFE